MDKSPNLPRLIRSDGQEIVIHSQVIIGRSPECSLQITDSQVSRQHAQLKIVNQQVFISDLGSRNGTWVNGNRIISPTPLEHGDRIRIGNTVLRLRMGDRPLPPDIQSVVKPAGIKETVTAGMSGEDVKRIMGEPQKITRGKDSVIWYQYPAVKIGLREDKVVIIQYTTELANISSPASQLESSISINSTCEHVRKHSGCLTAFLVLAVIGNAVFALLNWVMVSEVPHSMEGLALFSGCVNVAGVIFAIAILKWQKWGVYGYMCCAVIGLLLDLSLGGIIFAIRGLILIVLLAFLIRPSWDKMD